VSAETPVMSALVEFVLDLEPAAAPSEVVDAAGPERRPGQEPPVLAHSASPRSFE
jgi:hypothetical protein